MGLTLVEFETTPKEEIALKAIQSINGDCQKKIDAADDKRRTETQRVLKQYVIDNALYGIGDMLKPAKLPKYLKVESITARVHFGSKVVIEYHGKTYKKVGGEFIPTKVKETDALRRIETLTESNAIKA